MAETVNSWVKWIGAGTTVALLVLLWQSASFFATELERARQERGQLKALIEGKQGILDHIPVMVKEIQILQEQQKELRTLDKEVANIMQRLLILERFGEGNAKSAENMLQQLKEIKRLMRLPLEQRKNAVVE